MTEVVRRCIKYKKNKEEIERPKLIRLIIAITFSTLILLSMIILWIYVIIEIQPSLDALFTFSEEMRSDVTEIVDFMKIIKQYNNINSFYSAFRILNNINITLFLIRFIDLLQSYKAFKSITNTLTKAMWPLFAFLFYFAIILTGFALIAVVNFGADSGKFYNFEVSMETLSLFICCGIFDYQEVKRSSPTPAWFFLYFWVFVFLVVFVLLNFFLVIVYEAFDTTKIWRISQEKQQISWNLTMKSIRFMLLPSYVLKLIRPESIDASYSEDDLVDRGIPIHTAQRIIDIYGKRKSKKKKTLEISEEEEEEKENTDSSTM
eukprot:TRINITY_DN1947_c0_g1_i7.p1 TRINITY_DN1947_c0_g1~~TRINITY_DN1947_c0_g1_i7.p1  ORF type:complete len:319 (+),score=60.07 TRINITY_DN1947_c0_g1_i7:1156-2112(+)